MSEPTATLAKKLARLRQRSGLSVRQLEDVSGVSRAVISKTENGLRMPAATTLQKLATALGVDASELLTAAGYTRSKAETLPAMQPYLRTKYGHLPPEARQELIEVLNRLEA